MINFRLKNIDDIVPFGQSPDLSLHWFGLTDGDLWIEFGETTIYEYTDEALAYFGDKPTKYNDYQISRFLEDFSDLFKNIGESVPDKFYDLAGNLSRFQLDSQKWLDINDTDDDDLSDFYFDTYDTLISWTSNRKINSGHLLGGPNIYFFRNKDKIKIVWESDHKLENGAVLWTAFNGIYEMDYVEFIKQVKDFGVRFFESMLCQILQTEEKDWKDIQLDKNRLRAEHQERETDFFQKLQFLENDSDIKTDWTKIDTLYEQMAEEITKAQQ